MCKNKNIRKLIAGQLKTIAIHQEKIRQELEKPAPNVESVKKWEKDIDIARKKLRKLEDRLGR